QPRVARHELPWGGGKAPDPLYPERVSAVDDVRSLKFSPHRIPIISPFPQSLSSLIFGEIHFGPCSILAFNAKPIVSNLSPCPLRLPTRSFPAGRKRRPPNAPTAS